jgi:MFS transporter, BCD family, chlorophyll transporter
VVSSLGSRGLLGEALAGPAVGYSFVYHLEIVLLFMTLVTIGPLVRAGHRGRAIPATKFGLAEFPG